MEKKAYQMTGRWHFGTQKKCGPSQYLGITLRIKIKMDTLHL